MCVLLLLPGWAELLENLEHLVHDGHMAHGDLHEQIGADEEHAATDTEHGCTPVSHVCGCHTSSPIMLSAVTPVPTRSLSYALTRPPTSDDRPISRANAPPTRPPIA